MNQTFEQRREAFVKEYFELTKKHGVDYANYPVYYPNEKGGYDLQINSIPMDMLAEKKPFIQKDAPKA